MNNPKQPPALPADDDHDTETLFDEPLPPSSSGDRVPLEKFRADLVADGILPPADPEDLSPKQ